MTDLVQPKKAPSAYFIWLNENRAKIQAELGTKDVGKIGKKAGEMWKGMTEDAKKPFEAKQAEAKAQYEKDLKAFQDAGGEVGKRKSKKKDKAAKKAKKLAEKDKPKKPVGGGYGAYLAKHRADFEKEVPEGTSKLTGVTKIAGERWKNLSEAEKKPYQDEFAEKMKKYEELVAEWKKNRPAEEPSDDDKDEPPAKKARVVKEKKEKEPKPEKVAKAAGGRGRGRGRGGRGGGAAKAAPEAEIDPAVMRDAEKADMGSALRNLAKRDEIKAKGIDAKQCLAALKKSGGLVNAAKRALLEGK